MRYFVTGATGFIGRHFVPLLVARGGEVSVLVRDPSSARLAALRELLGSEGARLRAVRGDIAEEGLGIAGDELERLRGAEVFHLAAVYDLMADATSAYRANVRGTDHLVHFANRISASRLHYASSIAVAGRHRGRFTEEMFDVGQELDHPYFSTKHEAEAIVRNECKVPFRIYRPSMVIGSSVTGEADRVDGPYYAFKLIQKMRDAFPSWMPFVGPEGGPLNLVPVDFVARALDHIAHLEGRDGQTFHLVDPHPLSLGDTLNTFCRAAHAPEFALRFDRRMARLLPGNLLGIVSQLPAVTRTRKQLLDGLGIPETAIRYMDYPASFDATEATRALDGSGIECPPLETYAWKVWDYWERVLDPELPTPARLTQALAGKVIVITGASSGIGKAVALRLASTGAIVVGAARGVERLEETRDEVEALGGRFALYPTDLSDPEACARLIETVIADHGRVDVLVNNAGRSIRRSVTASLDRFHDFERTVRINYFGAVALTLAVLPGMRERGSGHIINVSSIGCQTYPPRFAAYVASKSALDAFARCLAPEVTADGIAVTTIHMPLVRTPMIEPTSIYRSFPTASPEEAAEMVIKALLTRPYEVSTRLGKFGELANAVAPSFAQLIMSAAYAALPESGGRDKPAVDGADGAARPAAETSDSLEAHAFSMLMRGIHL